jgi:hypothetical protein
MSRRRRRMETCDHHFVYVQSDLYWGAVCNKCALVHVKHKSVFPEPPGWWVEESDPELRIEMEKWLPL